MRHLPLLGVIALFCWTPLACHAQDVSPATRAAAPAKFPFLDVDVKAKRIRVECEALRVENPLEFFCCSSGTNEHESVLRSQVKPSHLHAALLMLGLEAGEPVRFSESANRWLPPHGPPLHIAVEFEKDGKTVNVPAYRLMRDIKSKREMPAMTWIFAGSRIIDGVYAADKTGYLVSVVNFDLTVIDIPKLASSANETLEWETNLAAMPAAGAKVTMIIEPAGKSDAPAGKADGASGAATQPGAAGPVDQSLVKIDALGRIRLNDAPVDSVDALLAALRKQAGPQRPVRVAVANPIEENERAREVMNGLAAAGIRFLAIPQADSVASSRPAKVPGEITADDALIRQLRDRWDQDVSPKAAELREAAKTHYHVISQLRREQQRLIDEADKAQRLIDQLEKRFQEMTTPQPE